MGAEHSETLEVLRELWRSQGQDAGTLADDCETRTCRRMSDAGVGFDEFSAGTSEEDRAAAWQERLKHEGKYNEGGGTLRDLILGQRP